MIELHMPGTFAMSDGVRIELSELTDKQIEQLVAQFREALLSLREVRH